MYAVNGLVCLKQLVDPFTSGEYRSKNSVKNHAVRSGDFPDSLGDHV